MAVKTVKSFEDALGHIQENSSRHSECIVTENKERAALFTKIVDAACVYTNVSTAFTDGAQFGLGAEIGISTQKPACPRSDGTGGNHFLQMGDRRRRTDQMVK